MRTRALRQPGLADQRGHRPERAGPSGLAWLVRPTSTNLHAPDGCPPRPAGTGTRLSAQEIASKLTWCRSSGGLLRRGRPAFCLSFCLIRHRPAPFTSVRSDRVCTVRGRWRTPVNAGQHCWKACWGQPLRSSNLLSSATSDQTIHQAGHGPVSCAVSFVVSFILRISV